MASEIHEILDKVPLVASIIPQTAFKVIINEELLYIPERIYHEEPDPVFLNRLTPLQSNILYCFFTRHHNGLLREKYLRKIMSCGYDNSWVIPYLIRILGEYVVEILQVIDENINVVNTQMIKNFIYENSTFFKTTESRVISYWNEYYRHLYPQKENYVGFKILNYLNEVIRNSHSSDYNHCRKQ